MSLTVSPVSTQGFLLDGKWIEDGDQRKKELKLCMKLLKQKLQIIIKGLFINYKLDFYYYSILCQTKKYVYNNKIFDNNT